MANAPDDKPKKHTLIIQDFGKNPFIPPVGINCRSSMLPIDAFLVNKVKEDRLRRAAQSATPWRPGKRHIDISDRPHDCVFGPNTLAADMIGVMDCAALSADLIIRKVMKESEQ